MTARITEELRTSRLSTRRKKQSRRSEAAGLFFLQAPSLRGLCLAAWHLPHAYLCLELAYWGTENGFAQMTTHYSCGMLARGFHIRPFKCQEPQLQPLRW